MVIAIGASLATVRFAKHNPVAVLSSGVVRHFPFRVDDWTLANLDDAIARGKTDLLAGLNQFDMRPLVAMIVDVVGDFSE